MFQAKRLLKRLVMGVQMKSLQKFSAGYDSVINYAAFLSGVVILYVMLQITVGVVLRYAFNRSLVWQMEFVEFTLVVMCFLVATWVLKVEGHVNMDLVISRLKPQTQDAIHGILSILMAFMCLFCAYYGVETSWIHFRKELYTPEVLNIPTWIYIAFVGLGMVLLFIQCIRRAITHLRRWRMSSDT